jgi:hypothetical protein
MQRRKWDAKLKAMIVIESLRGKPVAELCKERQISQGSFISGVTVFSPMPPRKGW